MRLVSIGHASWINPFETAMATGPFGSRVLQRLFLSAEGEPFTVTAQARFLARAEADLRYSWRGARPIPARYCVRATA